MIVNTDCLEHIRTMGYDSREDTLSHIDRVRSLLRDAERNIERRRNYHDQTKLIAPEKPIFDTVTPRLKELTYGSDEYKASLAEMKTALDHHYSHNRHHPEHFKNGIDGMTLLDLTEMLCDWKAAGERHANGSMVKSLEINRERFNISPQVQSVLENTAREMGWIE